MTLELRRELAELAGDARTYADAAVALDRARRLRRRRRLVPAGAAVALAAVAAVVWASVAVPAERQPLLDARTDPAFPASVAPPEEPPPLLPDDRPVGEAALAYQCRGCPGYLVLPDGTHYRLPDYADRDGGRHLGISPDGRWLALETAEGMLVRDLTGTRQWWHQNLLPVGWSPDSRWLLGTSPGSGSGTVVDTATGEPTLVRGDPGGQLGLAPNVLDSGELVVLDDRATADDQLVLRIVDPAGGELQREVRVDTRPGLRAGERTTIPDPELDAAQASVVLGGGEVMMVVVRAGQPGPAGPAPPVAGVLLVSTHDGELLGRVDPRPGDGVWLPIRYDGERVLAIQGTGDRGGAVAVLRHDPAQGAAEVVSRLPSGAGFVLRGTAGWLFDPGTEE